MPESTVLIIPPNDAEAVLISRIAEAAGIPMIRSKQGHGARLDKERGLVKKMLAGGYDRAVIVELPGPATEAKLRDAGVRVEVIDHHRYGDIDRSHDLSSLEQFLKRFRLSDEKLERLGFDPKWVRAIAILDRGYVWALEREGYGWKDIRKALAYRDELCEAFNDPAQEARKTAVAKRAWARRERWNGYYIVRADSVSNMRTRVSRIMALALKRPHPLIMVEQKRGFIYVQEAGEEAANALLEAFGGFTYGEGGNWGYKNLGAKRKVGLRDVKRVLSDG